MTPPPEQFDVRYQVGGSLPPKSQIYVQRAADIELFDALQAAEFCYVLNARQMGKSSLRVRTMERLRAAGVLCGAIDLSAIGTYHVSMEQWYATIAGFLAKRFHLSISTTEWWQAHQHLSAVNRLSEFIESVLLVQVQAPLVIFIDEIDTVLSLKFSTDDFFALIRLCFNQRATHPAYRRLTFALFGVTTPSELIADKSRTPFNLGRAIALQGFQWEEATSLLPGLATACTDPEAALRRIFEWTGGQPFLTQKLCQLVVQSASSGTIQQADTERPISEWIDHLVQTSILENWESQDEPEHLRTIRDRLVCEQRASRLLALYQRILLQSPLERTMAGQASPNVHTEAEDLIRAVDSRDQNELLLSGLVEKCGDGLRVKNPIYQTIFSLDWVNQQLRLLRPYELALQAWVTSGYKDESRLLRGQTLQEVLEWSKDKSLSDLDYRFLAASQECDRHEMQAKLEAARLKEVEARLALERQQGLEQQQRLRVQRLFSRGLAIALLAASISAGVAYHQYQQTAVSEVRAVVLSSEALFASRKPFDALLQAIQAQQTLHKLPPQAQADLKAPVEAILWHTVLDIQQFNRLTGHAAAVLAVDYSKDGQQIATAGSDGTIKIWGMDGRLLRTIQGSETLIRALKFSPDGTLLASGGDDRTIKLWQLDGSLVTTIRTLESGIWSLDFSPDSTMLVSGGPDSVIKLWSREGTLISAFPSKPTGLRSVAFSPDGQTIAAGNVDTTVEIWSVDGKFQRTLHRHKAPVQAIAFHPNGKTLVSGSADGMLNVWSSASGELLNSIEGHNAAVWGLDFAPDGRRFASASWDNTVKLWLPDGQLADTLYGHNGSVWSVAFSPDSQAIASVGADNVGILWTWQSQFQHVIHNVTGVTMKLLFAENGSTIVSAGSDKAIKFWALEGPLQRSFDAHDAAASSIDLSPDGKTLASVSEDKTLKLWTLDGTLHQAFPPYTAALISNSWHPSGELLAASSANGNITIWSREGTLLHVLEGHTAPSWDVAFSPVGDRLASASNDSTVRLWTPDGQLIKTLEGHELAVWRVEFSPTGDLLASGSGDATVKLWTPEGRLIRTLKGHQAAVWGIAFSPDGSLIATGSIDETIKLWRRDGTLIATLDGHDSGIRSVAFHPAQPLLISAGDDQTIRVWQLDRILNLEPLSYACQWVSNYLRTNSALSEQEKALCS